MNPTDSKYILLDITYKYENPNGFKFMHRLFTERKKSVLNQFLSVLSVFHDVAYTPSVKKPIFPLFRENRLFY